MSLKTDQVPSVSRPVYTMLLVRDSGGKDQSKMQTQTHSVNRPLNVNVCPTKVPSAGILADVAFVRCSNILLT